LSFFKPESISKELQEQVIQRHKEHGAMSREGKLAIIVVVSTVVLWFAGTWIEILNPVFVAGCAVFIMFMPGINLLTWQLFVKEVEWNVTLMVGGVFLVVGSVNATGAMDWIITNLLGEVSQLSPFWLMLLVGFIIAAMRIVIPTGPAVVTIFAPVLLGLAAASGQGSIPFIMLSAYWSGAAMLLVFTEPRLLITFSHGYYTARDMFIVGIFPTILMILVMAIFFQPYAALFGY
jgi:sodium-dependent dicarboxylate transporter 2/3/5